MALIEHANLKPWAAITGPRRAILHPDLERRNDEDPDKRWVLAKSVHALHVWEPDLPLDHNPDARYTDAHAEAYARRALMPAIEFRAGAHLSDDQLAARLRVPVEKIADRRAETRRRAGPAAARAALRRAPPGARATRRTGLQRTPAPPPQTTRRTTLNDRSATTPTQHPVCAIEPAAKLRGPTPALATDRTR